MLLFPLLKLGLGAGSTKAPHDVDVGNTDDDCGDAAADVSVDDAKAATARDSDTPDGDCDDPCAEPARCCEVDPAMALVRG